MKFKNAQMCGIIMFDVNYIFLDFEKHYNIILEKSLQA